MKNHTTIVMLSLLCLLFLGQANAQTNLELILKTPCGCNNDQPPGDVGLNGIGSFTEELEVANSVSSDIIYISFASVNSSATTGMAPAGVGAGYLFTWNGSVKNFSFVHFDGDGYDIEVTWAGPDNTVGNADDVVLGSLANRCAYPSVEADGLGSFGNCSGHVDVPLTATATDPGGTGTGVWTGMGVNGSNFNPAGLPEGTATLTYTYTGADDGSGGVSPDNGVTVAYSGCEVTASIDVQITEYKLNDQTFTICEDVAGSGSTMTDLTAFEADILGGLSGSQVLNGSFVENNGAAGNMFDLNSTQNILLTGLDIHTDALGTVAWEVYYVLGTFVGNETNAAAWTLLDSGTANGAGTNNPTNLAFGTTLNIPAGTTYGLYVTLTAGSGLNYLNGTTVGNLWQTDGIVTIYEGVGKTYPFGLTYTTRNWNGNVYYQSASAGACTLNQWTDATGTIVADPTMAVIDATTNPFTYTCMDNGCADEAIITFDVKANCDAACTTTVAQECDGDVSTQGDILVYGADGGLCSCSSGFILEIQTPCSCNNDQPENDASLNGVGSFTEILEVTSGSASDLIYVSAIATNNAASTGTLPSDVAVGDAFTWNGTAHELTFTHYDGDGYFIEISWAGTDNAIGTADDVVINFLGNRCAYPAVVVDPVASLSNCVDHVDVPLTATITDPSGATTGSWSGAGVTGSNFNPAGLPAGTNPIFYTYTGTNDGNGGLSPDNGATVVYPGCNATGEYGVAISDYTTEDIIRSVCEDETGLGLATIDLTVFEDEFAIGGQVESVMNGSFTEDNGAAGNMFDLNSTQNIELTGLDIHTDILGSITWEVYYIASTFVGNEANAAAWTLLDSGTVTGAGAGNPTNLSFATTLNIPAATSYGLYVTTTASTLNYLNGTAVGTLWQTDGTVSIYEGVGKAYPFANTYTTRNWNGNIYYSTGGVCTTGEWTDATGAVVSDPTAALVNATTNPFSFGCLDYGCAGVSTLTVNVESSCSASCTTTVTAECDGDPCTIDDTQILGSDGTECSCTPGTVEDFGLVITEMTMPACGGNPVTICLDNQGLGGLFILEREDLNPNNQIYQYEETAPGVFNYVGTLPGISGFNSRTYGMDIDPISRLWYIVASPDGVQQNRHLFTYNTSTATLSPSLGQVVSSTGNTNMQAMTFDETGNLWAIFQGGILEIIDIATTTGQANSLPTVPAPIGGVGLAWDFDNNRFIYANYGGYTVNIYGVDATTGASTMLLSFSDFNNDGCDETAQGLDYVGNGLLYASTTYACDIIYTIDINTGVLTEVLTPTATNGIGDGRFTGVIYSRGGGPETVDWSDDMGDSYGNSGCITVSPTENTTYIGSYTNSEGCVTTASIEVMPEECFIDPCTYLGNSSPNGLSNQFTESIAVTTGQNFESWQIASNTGFYDPADGVTPLPAGTFLTQGPVGTYTLPGVHDNAVGYSVTVCNICDGTDDLIISNLCLYTSTTDVTEAVDNMKVYPVPAKDKLMLEYESGINGDNLSIKIYTNDGRVMYSNEEMISEGVNLFEIDIDFLPAGTYFIKTIPGKGLPKAEVFVKISG